MERNFRIIIIAGLVGLFALSAFAEKKGEPDEGKTDKINWMPLDQGLLALDADSSGKHVFIDVTAKWCGWCKKMERDTFSDPEIIKFLNEKFISVKLWGDSNKILDIQGYQISERNLVNGEFRVSGYPGFYFLTPDKKKLQVPGGYKTKEVLMSMLTYVDTRKYEAQLKQDDNSQTEKNRPQ